MRHSSTLTFLMLIGLGLFHIACTPTQAAESKTFTGEYQWSQGGDGALEAEFRPKGENTWKIKFRFEFNGKSYTWKGTATGSLEDGSKVSGTAKGGGGRTWDFNGSIENGVMTADHVERRGSGPQKTGTFKISR